MQAARAGGIQFVASSWPVASLLQAHLTRLSYSSIHPFLSGKAPGMTILRGKRLLVWSSLSCWFCTTEMRRGSKYHCGLICPHSLCWLGSELDWASIWCQEKTVWIGTLCLSGFPLMQSSEQSQKTKSQGWPGSQNENHAMFDLPLKARSRGYAPSCQPKWHTHLPWSLVIPGSVLWLGAGIHFPCVSAILCRIPG